MRKRFRLEDAVLEHRTDRRFDDNGIEFSLRYVVDIRKRRVVKDLLYTRMLEEIEAYKESIELASQTIELVHPRHKK